MGYEMELAAFQSMDATPRRFAAVNNLGHLFCSDLCWIGEEAGGVVQIAIDHGIGLARWFRSLGEDGCSYLNDVRGTRFLDPPCGWHFVNYATSAAFEEVLRCDSSMRVRLTMIKTGMSIPSACSKDMVFDYRE